MRYFYLAVAMALLVNMVPCIYQSIKGPTIQDTLISMSILNTKTVVVMLLLSAFFQLELYLDISFVFAFLYFVVVYGVSRHLEALGGPIGQHDQ